MLSKSFAQWNPPHVLIAGPPGTLSRPSRLRMHAARAGTRVGGGCGRLCLPPSKPQNSTGTACRHALKGTTSDTKKKPDGVVPGWKGEAQWTAGARWHPGNNPLTTRARALASDTTREPSEQSATPAGQQGPAQSLSKWKTSPLACAPAMSLARHARCPLPPLSSKVHAATCLCTGYTTCVCGW